MKTGSANLNFFGNFSQLPNICLFTVFTAGVVLLLLLLFSFFFFFRFFYLFVCLFCLLRAFPLEIFIEVDVDIVTTPLPLSLKPHPYVFFLPTIISSIQVTATWNHCAPEAGFGAT